MPGKHVNPTLTAAFYAQAELCKTAIAIQDFTNNGQVLGYSELAQRAQAFAKYLAAQGVSTGSSVPLIGERGVETIIALLGILSCGARYIPLYPKLASASVIFQLHRRHRTKIVVYVSGTTLPREDCLRSIQFVNVRDALFGREATDGQVVFDRTTAASQACCLLLPDGDDDVTEYRIASLSHTDLWRSSCIAQKHLQIRPGRRVGQVFDIASDLASWPLFACLCYGGTLVIRGSDWHTALKQMDILICTPAILCNLSSEQFVNLDTIATAYEAVSPDLAKRWSKDEGHLWLCSISLSSSMLVAMQKCPTPSATKRVHSRQASLHHLGSKRQGSKRQGSNRKAKLADQMLTNESTITKAALDFPGVLYAVTVCADSVLHCFVVPASMNAQRLRMHLEAKRSPSTAPIAIHFLRHMPFTVDGRPYTAELRRIAESHSDAAADVQPMASVTASPLQAASEPVDLRSRLLRLILSLPVMSMVATMVNAALIPVVVTARADGQLVLSLATAHFTVTILLHQDIVMNCLILAVSRLPRPTLPLWFRHIAAGIHDRTWFHATVGTWGYVWSLWSAVHVTLKRKHDAKAYPSVVIAWVLVGIYSIFVMAAVPMFRRHYTAFHALHRGGAWTIFTLLWVLAALWPNAAGSNSFRPGAAASARFGVLALPLICMLLSWGTLRRVVVTYKTVTDQTTALYISDWVPPHSTWVRVSTSPWTNWYCVPATPASQASAMAMGPGCTLVAFSSSSWAQNCFGHQPRLAWVRRLPVYDFMWTAGLFEKILVVATGSGIIPLLSFLRRPLSATQLIWSASAPAEILGREKLEEVRQSTVDYVIHDPAGPMIEQREQLARLVREWVVEAPKAEAIFMVGDEQTILAVKSQLKSLSIPLYAKIYD